MNARHLLLLLRLKLNILINGFTKNQGKKRFRKLIALAGGGFLFFFIYKWIFDIFSVLITYPTVLVDNSMAMIFLGFFIFLLASGITVSIHYLFVSSDLPLLLTSPVTNNTIFTFKLIEAMFANSTFFLVMGFPIFIVYGLVMQASWYYYPLMLANSLVFLTIPVSISFLGALVIIRIIPPVRAKEMMAVLLGIISLGIWLILQLVRASSFNQNSQEFNPQAIEALSQISHSKLFNLLPSTLAAQALKSFVHFDVKLMVLTFIPLLALTMCIWIICAYLTQHAFKQGYINSEHSLTLNRKKKKQTKKDIAASTVGLFSSQRFGAIFLRDFKLLTRDTRQLMNIFMFAMMMLILPLLQKPDQVDSDFSLYFPYIFLIIFASLIAGQISSRLIPLEGKAFWITKLSPKPSSTILFEKFVLGFITSMLLAWTAVIIIGIYFHHPLRLIVLALLASMSFSGVLSSVGILLATYYGQFDWDHPKRMLSSAGALLLSLSSIIIVAAIGGSAALIYVIGNSMGFSIDSLDFLAGGYVLILSSLLIILIINMSGKKMDKMEWIY